MTDELSEKCDCIGIELCIKCWHWDHQEVATENIPVAPARFCHPTNLTPLRPSIYIPFATLLLEANSFQSTFNLAFSYHGTPSNSSATMAKTTTLKEFESVFPKLVDDLLAHAQQYGLPAEFVEWYKAVRATRANAHSIDFRTSDWPWTSHWMQIQSVESAIEECRFQTPSPSSSKLHWPKSNTSMQRP